MRHAITNLARVEDERAWPREGSSERRERRGGVADRRDLLRRAAVPRATTGGRGAARRRRRAGRRRVVVVVVVAVERVVRRGVVARDRGGGTPLRAHVAARAVEVVDDDLDVLEAKLEEGHRADHGLVAGLAVVLQHDDARARAQLGGGKRRAEADALRPQAAIALGARHLPARSPSVLPDVA